MYDESQSLAEALEELLDPTFPPIRYQITPYGARYISDQSNPQQRRLNRAKSQDGGKFLLAQLDVSHYKPEEVSCKVEDGKVFVNGKHYSENQYGYEASEFHRCYSLPEGTDPTSLKSRISPDGILQLEAAKLQPKNLVLDPLVGYDETDDSKVLMKFNLGGYLPQEINVSVKGNELTVSAEHKMEEEGHFTHKQFKRRIALPDEVDVDSLSSKFSKDGVLSIQACKKSQQFLEEKKIEVQEEKEEPEGGSKEDPKEDSKE